VTLRLSLKLPAVFCCFFFEAGLLFPVICSDCKAILGAGFNKILLTDLRFSLSEQTSWLTNAKNFLVTNS